MANRSNELRRQHRWRVRKASRDQGVTLMKLNLAAMTALAGSLVLTAAVGASGAPNLDFKSSLGTGSGLSNSPATAEAAGPAAVGRAAAPAAARR
jgi:hypothetical protein